MASLSAVQILLSGDKTHAEFRDYSQYQQTVDQADDVDRSIYQGLEELYMIWLIDYEAEDHATFAYGKSDAENWPW